MLDLKFVRGNIEQVEAMLAKRRQGLDLEEFKRVDRRRRDLLHEQETLRHEQKTTSEKIGAAKKAGEDASDLMARMKQVSARVKELDPQVREIDQKLRDLLLVIPNMLHESVPEGDTDRDNLEIRTWGTPPEFDFEIKDHVDLGANLGILDLERSAKIAGARFYLLCGAGALMERALINFMLDLHTGEHRYREVLPPFMVNADSMTGTGQLPKFEEDLFKVERGDNPLYLVPTAEVPVTNIHRQETLAADLLPIRYVAYTPCFRSEAGSYGKDTRGLIRLHQFNKVEMVKFVHPDTSWDELESLTENAEEVLRRLELPYRVVSLCSADVGFSAAKCYDLEVWLPGQSAYREISSCSNFTDYQARRAGIRFKGKGGSGLVHTLNGSGLAVGRTFVAILENHQQPDGTVIIPEALRPYMGGMERLEPETGA